MLLPHSSQDQNSFSEYRVDLKTGIRIVGDLESIRGALYKYRGSIGAHDPISRSSVASQMDITPPKPSFSKAQQHENGEMVYDRGFGSRKHPELRGNTHRN